jgi:hypothetical protein
LFGEESKEGFSGVGLAGDNRAASAVIPSVINPATPERAVGCRVAAVASVAEGVVSVAMAAMVAAMAVSSSSVLRCIVIAASSLW